MTRQLDILLRDIGFAFRSLRREPAFTIAAICALVIGIGANTAIFSVVDQVLLRPLTYPDPSRIVLFFVTTPQGPAYGASAAKYNVWRQQRDVFQNVAAYEYTGTDLNVTGGSFPEQIHSIRVSADYFPLLGAPIAKGRTFTQQEDTPGGGHVAILSYGFWQRRFGGDDRITGRALVLGGEPYTIIGVTGPTFNTELDTAPEIFLPFQIDPASADHATYFHVAGRLKAGFTIPLAEARLQLAASEFRRRFPNIVGAKDGFGIQPFQDAIVTRAKQSLLLLTGAVGFVLLIACANVANLLLVRATGRKREMAIRSAVGGTRGRIIRQLLTESVVLSLMGGALGLVFGSFGVRALIAANPVGLPRLGEHASAISMDWRLLLFATILSLITGVLFGLIPALNVSRNSTAMTLKERGGQARIRSLLVTGETALALVLLISAGLLIRSLVIMRTIDRGVDTHRVLTMRTSLASSRFLTSSTIGPLIKETTRRIDDVPGVALACASYSLPLGGAFGIPFNIVGKSSSLDRYDGRGWLTVSPGYFQIMRIGILRGREFTDRDDIGAKRVAIINESLARQFWPNGDAVGSRIILGKGYGPEFAEPAREIVGVVGDVLDFDAKTPRPVVYVPIAQATDGIISLLTRASSLTWVVKTRSEPHALIPAVRNVLQRASLGVPVTNALSLDDTIAESTAESSFQVTLFFIFGTSALLLAAIGINGVMAYSMRQRTHEIGIRLALGAERAGLQNMLIRQGMRAGLIGIILGIGTALGVSRLLEDSLFGVKPWDPATFCAVPVFLIAVMLFAVWIPSRRAAKLDPLIALRHE